MTSAGKEKSLIEEAADYVRSNSTIFLGVGLTLTGFALALGYLSKRQHPDLRRVILLRSVIEKSYTRALQSLQSLKIEKRILTEYGIEAEKQGHDSELNMLYLLITRLKLKEANKQKELRNPFLPPFEEGLFISELEPTHRLLYNKFNIFSKHLLVVTKEFQAQSNQLTEADFKQSILVMKALDGLLFYNSGPQAGSSQPHKHIQIFPNDSLELPIVQRIIDFTKSLSQTYDFQTQPIAQFPAFNFIHGLVLLKPEVSLSISKKSMHRGYRKILQQKVYAVNAKAYNILATDEFILIVARRKEKAFDEIAINSVGFMGSVLFKDQEKLNKYLSLKIKPNSILQDITYPKDYEPSRLQVEQKPNQKPQSSVGQKNQAIQQDQ